MWRAWKSVGILWSSPGLLSFSFCAFVWMQIGIVAMVDQSDKHAAAVEAFELVEADTFEATPVGADLNTVVKTMKSSSENFDSKIDKLAQDVAGMKSEITTMKNGINAIKDLMEKENKQKSLERARQFALVHEEFSYYKIGSGLPYRSSVLAKTAIELFLFGRGYLIPEATLTKDGSSEADKRAFRDKLTGQIKFLIKSTPRLVKGADEKFTMYYK